MSFIKLFIDGACKGNGKAENAGGWAAILETELKNGKPHRKELTGAEANTTNQRMELLAAIMGLEALKIICTVVVFTDSVYVATGATQWLSAWKANGWRTSKKSPVKNMDLWQRLDTVAAKHQITWCWVEGHATHAENLRADALASEAALAFEYRDERGNDTHALDPLNSLRAEHPYPDDPAAAHACSDCGISLDPEVCHSAAGYYIGQWCDCGPYSRMSEYFATREDASCALPVYQSV